MGKDGRTKDQLCLQGWPHARTLPGSLCRYRGVYLGALTFALAYALLYSGLRTTSSSAAVVAALCEPVAAAVFLDERLGVWGIVGIALVVAAIASTAREQHPTGAGPVADPDPGRPRVTR